MEDYKVIHPKCNMLYIGEIEEVDMGTESATFPPEYEEYKEGVAQVDETSTPFWREKLIKYEESSVKKVNLGDEDNSSATMDGDNGCNIEKCMIVDKIYGLEFIGTCEMIATSNCLALVCGDTPQR